jgi:hypothetical protein
MRIVFDLNVYGANQVLRCLKMGQMVFEISGNSHGSLKNLIADLEKVVTQMQDRDPTIGDTAPTSDREKQIYLLEEIVHGMDIRIR